MTVCGGGVATLVCARVDDVLVVVALSLVMMQIDDVQWCCISMTSMSSMMMRVTIAGHTHRRAAAAHDDRMSVRMSAKFV